MGFEGVLALRMKLLGSLRYFVATNEGASMIFVTFEFSVYCFEMMP